MKSSLDLFILVRIIYLEEMSLLIHEAVSIEVKDESEELAASIIRQ
jgi:hypothetical protein